MLQIKSFLRTSPTRLHAILSVLLSPFYDMVSVDKCDAQSLCSAIKISFEENKISLDNIIGFFSDTCNVMFGEHQSVTSLMKADLPHIVFVCCNCHMIHLCVSHACLKIFTSLEDLCRNVYTHFSRSKFGQIYCYMYSNVIKVCKSLLSDLIENVIFYCVRNICLYRSRKY